MNNKDTNRINKDIMEIVFSCLEVQADSISSLQSQEFAIEIRDVSEEILESEGDVITSGIGKSGDVSNKINSIFNSIGIKSKHIHPVDAFHGDLGTFSEEDIIILLSNSGNTDEMVNLLNALDRIGSTTVSITSNPESELGKRTDYHVNTKVETEGAITEPVPMASSTVSMVIGDCIANILMYSTDFDKSDYSNNHPGGIIGKMLNFKISDLITGEVPSISPTTSILESSLKISEGQKGIVAVVDENNHLLGVVTDGDLRREISKEIDVSRTNIQNIMTENPITINTDLPAVEALNIMEQNEIGQLAVINEEGKYEGIVHMRDLVRKGIK